MKLTRQFVLVFLLGVSLIGFLRVSSVRGDLVISQVVEGSSFNKALVLQNRGEESLELSKYTVDISYNTKPFERVLHPVSETTLSPGEQFFVCHSRISEAAKPFCDAFTGGLLFNGNDAVALLAGMDTADKFGDENVPGEAYEIAGVADASKDHTVVRKPEVKAGTTDWEKSSMNEWEVLGKDVMVLPNGTVKDIGGDAGGSTRPPPPKPDPVDPRPIDPRPPAPPVPPKGYLVIGTFNTEFLFDGVSDSRISPYKGNPEAAKIHFGRIEKVIERIKPDILNMAEVEDEKILDRMADAVGGGLQGYFVQGEDSFTGQDVALLSKYRPTEMYRTDERSEIPLPGSECGSTRVGDTGVSKNYIALFDENPEIPFKFAIVGLHLKAIPTKPSACAQREGQAAVVQREVAKLISAGYEVVVMGDLNDYSDEVPDVNGHKPTSRVMAMLRDPNNDGVDELENVLSFLPQKDTYTSWYDKDRDGQIEGFEFSAIDHVLLTEKLYDRIEEVHVDHEHNPDVVSDHWPVLVRLKGSPPSESVGQLTTSLKLLSTGVMSLFGFYTAAQ